MFHNIIGFFAVFIGRPTLIFIKWLRWPFLFFGLYFNAISTYNPKTGLIISKFTIIPLIVGVILFSVGCAVQRYDEIYKEYKNHLKGNNFNYDNINQV